VQEQPDEREEQDLQGNPEPDDQPEQTFEEWSRENYYWTFPLFISLSLALIIGICSACIVFHFREALGNGCKVAFELCPGDLASKRYFLEHCQTAINSITFKPVFCFVLYAMLTWSAFVYAVRSERYVYFYIPVVMTLVALFFLNSSFKGTKQNAKDIEILINATAPSEMNLLEFWYRRGNLKNQNFSVKTVLNWGWNFVSAFIPRF